jgi:integrase/recombinase XerD
VAVASVISGYLDHLAVERGTARNTLDSYTRDLRRYADYLGGRGIADLDEVSSNQISEFLAALR